MKKMILALLLAVLFTAALIPGAAASSSNATMDFAAFLQAVEEANYNYDGNGVTVQWSPSSACTDNRANHACLFEDGSENHQPDGNNAQRIQKPNAQYQIFSGAINVSISNVNFEFVPADFKLCMNSAWGGTATAEDTPNAELQLKNTGNVTFKNCTFDKVIASPFSSTTTTTFEGCKFSNVYDAYAIKDVHSANLYVTDCTFDYCSGAIYLEGSTPKNIISITGNTFKDIDKNAASDKVGTRGLIQFSAAGDYSNASIVISGNSSNNDAAVLRQLNPTVSRDTVEEAISSGNNQFSGGLFTADSSTANIVLPDKCNFEGNNTVYDGSRYYTTLKEALAGIHQTDNHTLWCKPGANVGSMTHGHVCSDLTVYGNGAYISDGERDFEIDTYDGNSQSGSDLTGDVTLKVYYLKGAAAWGQRNSTHTVTIYMEGCENMDRIYFSGVSGANNITLVDCTFDGTKTGYSKANSCTVYSNAPGEISIKDCTFVGVMAPVNLNNKSDVNTKQTVSVKNCTFTDCSTVCNDTEKLYAAPIRVLSTAGAESELTVDSCTFTYSEGKEPANGDILLGEGRVGEQSYPVAASIINTAANVQIQNPGDRTNESNNAQKITVPASSQPVELSNVVAMIGENKYVSIEAAIAAAKDGDTVTILPGTHALAADKCIIVNKRLTIRGSGEDTVISGSGTVNYGNGLFTFTAGSEGSVLEDLTLRYISTGAQRAAIYFDGGFTGGSADNVTKIRNVHIIGGDSLANISTSIGISSTYMTGGFIEVSGCTLKNLAYGMYFNGVHDLTISGNTIDGTKYNAINIAGDSDEYGCYDVSISGNTLRNISYANYSDPLYSSGISVGTNATVEIGQNDISMLNGKESVYFVPDDTPGTRYIVSVVVDGKTISQAAVNPGGSFTLPAAPSKSGYIFMGWKSGNDTYKAQQTVTVNSDMTFYATWANMPDVDPTVPDEPVKFPFTDVSTGSWYYDAVYYVWENGLMNGTDTYKFSPNSPLTRAMVWAVLARIDGVKIEGDSWMTDAQKWAVAKGVSDGTNPTGYITREQLVTMLWRYKGSPAVEYTLTAPDASGISDWAVDAMKWAASIGLIEGDETGALNPASNSTRAHAATFFMRFCK